MADDSTVEFTRKSYNFDTSTETSPCLVVVKGPQVGALFPLKDGETIVGRCTENAEVVLTEPGISRKHARFEVDNGEVTVHDLGSTNGLHINKTYLEEKSARLQPGDTVTLSPKVTLQLSIQDRQVAEVMAGLYQKATLDSSGVLTKESFFERLEVKNECSLALLDIDHLDRIQDLHGHLAGESLTAQLAQTLKSGLGGMGFVGRLTGDTFIILVRRRALDADDVLEGVRKGIEFSNFRVDTKNGPQFLRATVSVGVSDLLAEDKVEDCIQAAEQALLGAKQMGRNRININPTR